MTLVGMDLELVRKFAKDLRGQADRLESAALAIETTSHRVHTLWQGPDATEFVQVWSGSHKPELTRLVQALQGLAQSASKNADDQDRISGGTGLPGGTSGSGVNPGSPTKGPHNPRDPKSVAAWWQSMTPQQQKDYLAKHPKQVGDMDGLPGSVRDQANRIAIQAEGIRVLREWNSLSVFEQVFTPRGKELSASINALWAINKEIDEHSGRQLLSFDLGHPPRVTIAVGNIDTAENVAIFTPGITSTVEGMGGYLSDSENLKRNAERLGGSTAVVFNLNYDAPDGFTDLATASNANATQGAENLVALANGIDAQRGPDVHLTAAGHSYGSLLTGIAAQRTSVFDDMVVWGSPGIGTSNLDDIQVPGGQVFLLEATQDPVADAARNAGLFPIAGGASAAYVRNEFGSDPSDLRGIENLSTSSSSEGYGVGIKYKLWGDDSIIEAHSEYMLNGSTSQHNIAAIVAHRQDRLVR